MISSKASFKMVFSEFSIPRKTVSNNNIAVCEGCRTRAVTVFSLQLQRLSR